MTRSASVLIAVVALLCVMTVSVAANGGSTCDNAQTPAENEWSATGTVTKVDGAGFCMLSDDNVVYTVDSSKSALIVNGYITDSYNLKVGDKVRVYGSLSEHYQVSALRVRVLNEVANAAAPESTACNEVIKIIVEKDASAASAAAGPEQKAAPEVPQTCNWDAHGLVSNVNYDSRQVELMTSTGKFNVNLARAKMADGDKRIGIGRINTGDSIRVIGNLVGLNKVDAISMCLLRSRNMAESALPQLPASIVGVITEVDYQSFTFKMQGDTVPVIVSADDNTIIQHQYTRMAFMELKPGMKVKMTGRGSLGTGYAAQYITVISVVP